MLHFIFWTPQLESDSVAIHLKNWILKMWLSNHGGDIFACLGMFCHYRIDSVGPKHGDLSHLMALSNAHVVLFLYCMILQIAGNTLRSLRCIRETALLFFLYEFTRNGIHLRPGRLTYNSQRRIKKATAT